MCAAESDPNQLWDFYLIALWFMTSNSKRDWLVEKGWETFKLLASMRLFWYQVKATNKPQNFSSQPLICIAMMQTSHWRKHILNVDNISGGCCGSTSKKTVVGGWAWAWWLVTDVQRWGLRRVGEWIQKNILFAMNTLCWHQWNMNSKSNFLLDTSQNNKIRSPFVKTFSTLAGGEGRY